MCRRCCRPVTDHAPPGPSGQRLLNCAGRSWATLRAKPPRALQCLRGRSWEAVTPADTLLRCTTALPQVLWPHLLQFLTPVRYTGALTPLCRSLVHLARKRQEAGPGALLIKYDGHGAQSLRASPRTHPDPDSAPNLGPYPPPRPNPGPRPIPSPQALPLT